MTKQDKDIGLPNTPQKASVAPGKRGRPKKEAGDQSASKKLKTGNDTTAREDAESENGSQKCGGR